MTVTILKPWQTAWVTNDLDHSLAIFRDSYGVERFFTFESELDATVFGRRGRMHVRVAMADVDEVQLEVIQPLGDGSGVESIYADPLPRDGGFAQRFHHVCNKKVEGTLEDWERYVAALPPERPICYTADLKHDARFCYTDDRPFLGHYVEHSWMGAETSERLSRAIPKYRSL